MFPSLLPFGFASTVCLGSFQGLMCCWILGVSFGSLTA